MNRRLKYTGIGLLLALCLVTVSVVAAQSPTVEWDAWNVQITAHADGQELDVAETQVINVTGGELHAGTRDYSQPVDVQEVYVVLNGGDPEELSEGSGPGTYDVSNSSDGVVLEYRLPEAASAGDSFVVQINYATDTPTDGLIDWFAVPGGHSAPVASSTVTINFPDGQAPDPSLVRLPQNDATVSVAGNSLVIQSQGAIPANQPFEIQVPFGSNIGGAGDTGSVDNSGNGNVGSVPSQPQPVPGSGDNTISLPGPGGMLGMICLGVCALGLLVMFGGGSLLRSLLGGLLGGTTINRGQSPFGGNTYGTDPYNNDPYGGNSGGTIGGSPTSSSGGRGFRESPNQNRGLPRIRSDKRSGGGETFK